MPDEIQGPILFHTQHGRCEQGTTAADTAQYLQKTSAGIPETQDNVEDGDSIDKLHSDLRAGDELCELCQALELSVNKFNIDLSAADGDLLTAVPTRHKMGTLTDVQARSRCPLCRLLMQAATTEYIQSDVLTRGANSSDTFKALSSIQLPECHVYWTGCGRGKLKRNQSPLSGCTKQTRRLCVTWKHRPLDNSYIILEPPEDRFTMHDDIEYQSWSSFSPLFDGKLTSLQRRGLTIIRSWLDICQQQHSNACHVLDSHIAKFSQDLPWRSATFTVIDLVDMCLVSLPDEEGVDARYVALSYTWGDDPRISGGHGVPPKIKVVGERSMKYNRENGRELEQKGGIRKLLEQKTAPKTLEQAIWLTCMLGYRYLWLDSLCILQDDLPGWGYLDLQLKELGTIYSNADLTICAADGDGPEAGLQALFPLEDKRQRNDTKDSSVQYQVKGYERFRFSLTRPSESYIERSRWARRAWTFQERLLSLRCLIFVAGKMFFQCRSSTLSEDMYSEEESYGNYLELQAALNQLTSNPIGVYKTYLEAYTQKGLSSDEGILDAFRGIEETIESSLGKNCESIFGLPNSHFDWALLWETEGKPLLRDTGKMRLPTWSWCGWKGARIKYEPEMVAGPEINLHEWLLNHTWITYYIRTGEGRLRLIWNPYRHSSSDEIEKRWKGYNSPKTGLPGSNIPDRSPFAEPAYDYHGRPFNLELPKSGRMPGGVQDTQFYRTVGTYRRRVAVINPETEAEGGRANYGFRENQRYLQFWTWSATLFLGEETLHERNSDGNDVGAGLRRFAILDTQGDFAGYCTLDKSWTEAFKKHQPQQFIALSDAYGFAMPEQGRWNFHSEDERDGLPWSLYNVMMIWYEEGNQDVAYRGGIGKVYKSAFGNGVDDGWKEIILS